MAISLTTERLQAPQFGNWLPRLAIVLLVLLLAWLLSRLTWQLLELWQSSEDQPGVVETIEGEAAPREAALFDWNNLPLFGEANRSAPVEQKPVETKPKVPVGVLKNLKLTVLGIVASSNPEKSYIVIKHDGETKVLRHSEEIRKGISIKAIAAKSFTATDGAADREFMLEMLAGLAGSPGAAAARRSVPQTTPQQTDDGDANRLPPVNFRVTNPRVRENIENYRETLTENPMELLGKIRTQAVPRNGETYGFRLYPGSDRMLMTGVGLRPGDILLSVNDNSVTDLTQLDTIIDSLSEATSVRLTIERGGKVRDLNVILEN
jgi:type II secretion system protein C